MKKEVKIMKYKLNIAKFVRFLIILAILIVFTWLFISYVEVVLKNTTENITYSNWNLLIKIFGK